MLSEHELKREILNDESLLNRAYQRLVSATTRKSNPAIRAWSAECDRIATRLATLQYVLRAGSVAPKASKEAKRTCLNLTLVKPRMQ